MKISEKDIANSLKDSTEVEVSKNGKQIRRAKNAPLPEKKERKRDTKTQGKEEQKQKKQESSKTEDSDVELDDRGNPILTNADFENPYIFRF